ncbi:cytochrome P450, partial [Lophiostoma macrostomum CBS 122681]
MPLILHPGHFASFILGTLLFSTAWAIRFVCARRWSKTSRSIGLEDVFRSWDVFGIGRVFRSVRATLDGTIVSHLESLWVIHGDTYTSNMMGTHVTFTRDAANIKQILSTNFHDYNAAEGVRDPMFNDLAPGSISATDGKRWEENRGEWRRYVALPGQLIDWVFVEASFQNMIKRVPTRTSTDLQPLLLATMGDITYNFAVGGTTNRIDVEMQSSEDREFVEAIKRTNVAGARRCLLGPVYELVTNVRWKADCAKVKRFLGDAVDQRISAAQTTQISKQQCFLDRVMLRTEDPKIMNYTVHALAMASDSLTGPLSHTIWLLARHPDVYDKLRQSVLEIVGYQKPTYEQLAKFTHVKHVLNESLRLFPPNPMTIRRANKDTWLPHGGGKDGSEPLLIRAGRRVLVSAFASQRNPNTFGNDALEFRPERWENASINRAGYLPFSLGPRVCTGKQIGLSIVTYLLIRVLQTFEKIESRDSADFEPYFQIGLSNKNGVMVSM